MCDTYESIYFSMGLDFGNANIEEIEIIDEYITDEGKKDCCFWLKYLKMSTLMKTLIIILILNVI